MKKQLTLLCLAAAAMALAGCGPTSSEGGSSGSSKEESSGKTSESTTSHASDSDSEQPSASTGSEESPDITQTTTDSDPEPEPEPLTIYFRDAAWWNEAAASTSITFDGSALTMLTYVRGPLEDGEGGQYNYWSYTFENPAEVTGFRFVRTGTPEDAPGTLEDWGARTVELTLEGRSDGDLYDISGSSASWVGDGGFVEGSWGTYDANDQGTPNPEEPDPEPDPEPGEDPITVYFRDAAWWNEAAASTSITFDGSALTMLTYVRGPLEDGEGGQYNYWSYTFEAPSEVETFRFVRTGTSTDNPGVIQDWGARTVELSLDGVADGAMYDIISTGASWSGDGNFVEGVWGTYDPEDEGKVNTAYLLGSGSFVTGDEWTAAGGVPFVKEGDGAFSALGVDLAEGDVFKVLYLNVWYGYGDMQGIVELADYFAESDGGNVLVTSDVTVDFALSVVDGATTLTIGLSQVA